MVIINVKLSIKKKSNLTFNNLDRVRRYTAVRLNQRYPCERTVRHFPPGKDHGTLLTPS